MKRDSEPIVSGGAIASPKANEHCGPKAKWAATIDDAYVPAPQQRVEAKVLKDQGSISPEKVLVRDLGGEHDVPLTDEQVVDLAEGNVFYSVPACDAPKPTGCHASPKLAFFVDDRPEETLRANQTRETIGELFGFTPDVQLFRDYESPNDQLIGPNTPLDFAAGPVFYTRRHHKVSVTIKINGTDYELHQQTATVKELKKLAGIPLADVLAQVVNGTLNPLADDGVVELHCGDVFISHPRDNASS